MGNKTKLFLAKKRKRKNVENMEKARAKRAKQLQDARTAHVSSNYDSANNELPTDPILRSKWVEVIRKSREEEFWKPAVTSVVCSEHFREKDMHRVDKKNRQRLSKKAVPRKGVYLASAKFSDENDEDSDNLTENNESRSNGSSTLDVASVSDLNRPDPLGLSKDIQCNSLLSNDASNDSFDAITFVVSNNESLPELATCSNIETVVKKEKESDTESFSDLDSVFDTPKESKFRREIRRRILLQKKHTSKIKSLRHQNLRLKKKIESLQLIIETLKKGR